MSGRDPEHTWKTMLRTAALVQADGSCDADAIARSRFLVRACLATLMSGAALGAVIVQLASSATPVRADAGADSTLFSYTNQDRASNGVRSVVWNGTLGAIGEGARYGCGGITVNGRSVDMIQRNYFSHVIAGCGQYVFSMMSAYGIHYQSAGENIGWVSGEGSGGQAAGYINGQFMNSPDHRSNILNGNYTDLGVGSAVSPPGVSWTGAGSPGYQDVWMFSEEFAQLHSTPPPPPPPPPRPTGGGPPRNSPAPGAPGQPPVTTGPAATPTPSATPTPTPVPAGLLPAIAPAPPIYQFQGLLPGSVESVLEAFLIA